MSWKHSWQHSMTKGVVLTSISMKNCLQRSIRLKGITFVSAENGRVIDCFVHYTLAMHFSNVQSVSLHSEQWREKKFLSKTSPRKSIGRPGLDPVPLTEAKTFPAFLLGSSAAFLLKGLTLVVLRGRVSGSMEVRRWKFEVTGENAVKRTLEADEEVAPAAVCVADTAVRVTAACMLTNEAAILFRMFPF